MTQAFAGRFYFWYYYYSADPPAVR